MPSGRGQTVRIQLLSNVQDESALDVLHLLGSFLPHRNLVVRELGQKASQVQFVYGLDAWIEWMEAFVK